MKLFDLEHKKVVVYPEALLIKEFKDVWDNDKTKDKKVALENLAFVYFSSDFKSIYRNFDEYVRDEKIKKDIISQKDWKKDELIIKAIDKYKELHKTYSSGLLEDVEYGLSKLREYFRNTADILADDTEGKATDKYLSNVKKVGELINTIKGLKETVEKELNESGRIRGGGILGSREMPKEKR